MVRAAAKNFRHVHRGRRPGGLHAAARAARPRGRHRRAHPALLRAEGVPPHRALRGRDRRLLRAGGGEGRRLRAWPRPDDVFPYRLALSFEKVQDLRYGENPHQRAAFYSDLGSTLYSVAAARKLQGKELSFNNILDLDAAWRLVTELARARPASSSSTRTRAAPAWARPCCEAYQRAWECDPVSAFGGILAFNRRARRGHREEARRGVRGGGDRARLRRRRQAGARGEEEPARDGHGHDVDPQGHGLRPAPRDGRRSWPRSGTCTSSTCAKCEVVIEAQADRRRMAARCSSPGRSQAREVERDRVRERPADGGRGRGPDEPRRLRAHRRA